MFCFPENAKINKTIEIDALSKLLYGKKMKYIKNYILKVEMQYLIDSDTIKLKKGNEIEQFYVIRIKLKRPGLPLEFLNKLDLYIEFPVFYCLEYEDNENYILPVYCLKNDKKQKPYRVFTSGWLPINEEYTSKYGCRIVKGIDKTIDDVYKNLIIFLCGLKKNGETNFLLEDYFEELKSVYNNDDYLRMMSQNNFLYAYRFKHLDIGYPTFNSLIDRFSEYVSSKSKLSCNFIFMSKYIADLHYKFSDIAQMGSRKIGDRYTYNFKFISNKQINKTDLNLLRNEYFNKVEIFHLPNEKQPSYLAKLVHIRTRTDDEIEEYKLIYGKYLSEPYTEEKIRKLNSEEEIEKRKERRKQNKIENQRKLGVRRKITAEDIEEMKKSSSRKIY